MNATSILGLGIRFNFIALSGGRGDHEALFVTLSDAVERNNSIPGMKAMKQNKVEVARKAITKRLGDSPFTTLD